MNTMKNNEEVKAIQGFSSLDWEEAIAYEFWEEIAHFGKNSRYNYCFGK